MTVCTRSCVQIGPELCNLEMCFNHLKTKCNGCGGKLKEQNKTQHSIVVVVTVL